jgi:hypothetical protein
VDREATKYIGLTIEWDYENSKVHMHIPGYLAKSMTRFKHETPTKIHHSPIATLKSNTEEIRP